jgi:hypothetical protein
MVSPLFTKEQQMTAKVNQAKSGSGPASIHAAAK